MEKSINQLRAEIIRLQEGIQKSKKNEDEAHQKSTKYSQVYPYILLPFHKTGYCNLMLNICVHEN